MKIIGFKEEIKKLGENSSYDFSNTEFKIVEPGFITDEEIDAFGKFSDYEKNIIKEGYSKHEKGFFPNPICALR